MDLEVGQPSIGHRNIIENPRLPCLGNEFKRYINKARFGNLNPVSRQCSAVTLFRPRSGLKTV